MQAQAPGARACAPRWRRRGKRKLNVVHGATIKIWLALFAPHSGRAFRGLPNEAAGSTRRPAPASCVVDAKAQPRRRPGQQEAAECSAQGLLLHPYARIPAPSGTTAGPRPMEFGVSLGEGR